MRYMRPTTIEHGERLFRRYGATTIFFARFIAGVRIVAGPLAGALRMDWPRFALWNLLGGIVWVTLISLLGYFLGGSWDTLVRVVKHLHLSAILIASAAIVVLWWRHRRTSGQRR
ncbi:MAG: DedA family protein [Acidobacteria bacterium]|nr:DedA family protein [Acidobacteriota bacterium]